MPAFNVHLLTRINRLQVQNSRQSRFKRSGHYSHADIEGQGPLETNTSFTHESLLRYATHSRRPCSLQNKTIENIHGRQGIMEYIKKKKNSLTVINESKNYTCQLLHAYVCFVDELQACVRSASLIHSISWAHKGAGSVLLSR